MEKYKNYFRNICEDIYLNKNTKTKIDELYNIYKEQVQKEKGGLDALHYKILTNFVNNKYTRASNQEIEYIWSLYKKETKKSLNENIILESSEVTTNKIRKGWLIKMKNGCTAVMMDNRKGNIRSVRNTKDNGCDDVIGSVYVWNIVSAQETPDSEWKTIKLTKQQLRDEKGQLNLYLKKDKEYITEEIDYDSSYHKGIKYQYQKEIVQDIMNDPETISMAKGMGIDLSDKDEARRVITNILQAIKKKKRGDNYIISIDMKIGKKEFKKSFKIPVDEINEINEIIKFKEFKDCMNETAVDDLVIKGFDMIKKSPLIVKGSGAIIGNEIYFEAKNVKGALKLVKSDIEDYLTFNNDDITGLGGGAINNDDYIRDILKNQKAEAYVVVVFKKDVDSKYNKLIN